MNKFEGYTGPNTGHGHVYPRADGNRARCGGASMCETCAADYVKKKMGDKVEVAYLDSDLWEMLKVAFAIGRPLSKAEIAILENFIEPRLNRIHNDEDRMDLFKIAVVVSGDQPTADEIAKRAYAAGFRKVTP